MANKEVKNVDAVSAEGFDTVDLAFPVRNQQGQQTHWRKSEVSRELYELQMTLDEEDRNPEFRKGAFKDASKLKAADFKAPVPEVEEVPLTDEQRRIADLEAKIEALTKAQAPAKTPAPPAKQADKQ